MDLAAIPHASTAIVTLAYRREEIPHPLDGHGYVVPRAEGRPILACTWSSRKWAGRAPEGWELIRVFIGRAGQEDVLAATTRRWSRSPPGSRHATWRDRTRLVDPGSPLAAWHAAIPPRSSRARHPDRGRSEQACGTLPRRQRVPRGRYSRLHRVWRARRGCGGSASALAASSRRRSPCDQHPPDRHPPLAEATGATKPSCTA